MNKHIRNSLDLLRQSANSLNELSHTAPPHRTFLSELLLADLSHLGLEHLQGVEMAERERELLGWAQSTL